MVARPTFVASPSFDNAVSLSSLSCGVQEKNVYNRQLLLDIWWLQENLTNTAIQLGGQTPHTADRAAS